MRPRRQAEAFLRRAVLPGEEAQVDWAHFGKVMIGRAERPLFAFVMVLSSSRQMIEKLAERGANLGATTSGLLQLLDREGSDLLERADVTPFATNQATFNIVTWKFN